MRLGDTGKEIADVALDAIAQADEQALDLEVLGFIFVVVIRDDDGEVQSYTGTWFDG
jgi:hypothetical protein